MPQEQIIQLQVDRPAPRLDKFLANSLPELSRSQIQKLIHQGRVLLSTAGPGPPNQIARAGATVRPGDLITLYLPQPDPEMPQPEAVSLDILFEDEEVVVVNKPAGMVVHPAHGHSRGTLVNALLARYPDLAAMIRVDVEAKARPGIVHRLDRDTSGLIIVTRTPSALRHLRRQFKARTVEKTYLALVIGRPDAPEGIIDVPLGRDLRHRQKFAPRPDGKPARTRYCLRQDLGEYSLLEIGLETGRTHQIRVHLAWLGCPVAGDTLYGKKRRPLGLDRQFLHAWRLGFEHPRTGAWLQLEAPLDDHLKAVLDRLAGKSGQD